jgi:hypothetical protein
MRSNTKKNRRRRSSRRHNKVKSIRTFFSKKVGGCGCDQTGGAVVPVVAQSISLPNSYKLNTYPQDPSRAMIMSGASNPFSVGGRKKRKTKRNYRGGTLFTQWANNSVGNVYKMYQGVNTQPSPFPTEGQLTNVATLSKMNYR